MSGQRVGAGTAPAMALMAALVMTLVMAAVAATAQQPPAVGGNEVIEDLDRRLGDYERLRGSPGGGAGARETFRFLDANGDGGIDRTEWNIRKMRIFTARDRNGDGKLSPEEVPAVEPEAFAIADTDGDGFIDGLEFNLAPFMEFDHGRTTSGPMTFEEFEGRLGRIAK